jgi:mannose-6-phosphate isomerase-like protein (cupin superfamily)
LTELHGGKETSGHQHDDADEIYTFISGYGRIELNERSIFCEEGDVFLIPRGTFHKVFNTGYEDLKFWSIFEKYGERK